MRPSISVTLEPGLEQGVPWGRDLYSFVTSAAGHMMRTLQKPRKNRPSKRQVNHRRFLHNMIQRKFADIEAANHRLASALEEKTESSLQPQTPATGSPSQSGHVRDPEKCSDHTDADDVSKFVTDVSDESHRTEVSEKKHPDSQHLWKLQRKSQPNTSTIKNNQGKGRKKKRSGNRKLVEFTSLGSPKETDYYHGAEVFQSESYNDSPLKSNLSEDTSLQNSSLDQFGQNMDMSLSFSPELSPLSLDSCDFSIQMFTDVSTCTQAQRSIADIAESPWADIMDLFSVGGKDLGGCLDVGAYFQSICAEVGADDSTFADQSGSFADRMCNDTSDLEDLHRDRDEYGYEYGYSCHGDQGLTINHTSETQFHHFKPAHDSDLAQNQFSTSTSCYYNMSQQRTEDLSPCKLLHCDKNQRFTLFEGVAQSFSVPLHNPVHCPVPTPPHEQDWLFPDILKERKSPDC